MRNGTEQMGCDRRILKAFYTQYVAVLLIILVFTVGAFQRTSIPDLAIAHPAPIIRDAPSIGALQIAHPFGQEGRLLADTAQLQAISMVLKEHDVRAVMTLSASMRSKEAEGDVVMESLAHIDALETFFRTQGVSDSSLKFVLDSSVATTGNITVEFEEVSHDKLPL